MYEACTCSHHEIRGCGVRVVVLRETFQPHTACLRFLEQRPARLAGAGVCLEAVESGAAEDAIKRVRKEQVELVALHSVTGVVWHHITCL
jgi:hypothetical protein